MIDYRTFLEKKIRLSEGCGFDVPLEEINPALKPHSRAIVQWGLRGGAARNLCQLWTAQDGNADRNHAADRRA